MPPMPPPRRHRHRFFLLGFLGDHGLGGQQQRGDGGGVLQGKAGHLGGVDDTGYHQVFIDAGFSIEAHTAAFLLDVLGHHGAFAAGRQFDAPGGPARRG